MAITAGTRLGPYEIVSALGAGGMGEVYKAVDARLERTVAIKILPDTLAADPQFRERFDREARAISQLTHPHICALFDVGAQDGTAFLVMEYLDGETVAERLKKGPLPVADALRVAIQIADALSTAHRHGIVHRDLKPGNVMLLKTGAKLLDFGLAKSASSAVATSGLSLLPTTPPNLTAQGTILGTFQYMAPEQIEGLEADVRTDIFALGALTFEMLTGRTPFEGKTRASLLGAILKDEPPPVSRLQPVAPAALDRVISTCLAKDPDERYQSARDLLRDLRWVADTPGAGASGRLAIGALTRWNRAAWLVAALSALALVAAAFIAVRWGGDVTPAAHPVQFTIAPPENVTFGGPASGGTGIATQVAVSPDGQNIAFVARSAAGYQIWLRPLATQAAQPIPGTEGAAFPFWSPDGRFIGFFATGKLKKVQITGGPPIVLCDAPSGRGGSWSRDNVIVFTPSSAATGIMRVSGSGGVPTVLTTLDPTTGETNHRWPHFLPDGKHFLYTATTGTCCPPSKPAVVRIASLDPSEPAVAVLQAESAVSYASGHIFFVLDQTLMAQPFDTGKRQPTGDAFPLAEQVSFEGSRYVSASVSESGTLVYGQGTSRRTTQLTWFDRAGRSLGTVGDAASYVNLALSPDERRLAVSMRSGANVNQDIWIIDIARNIRSRLTFDPTVDASPVWSPDGTRVAFEGARAGKASLLAILVSGTRPEEVLFEGSNNIAPTSWSRDGRFIAYTHSGASPSTDIWVLPVLGDRKPFPFVQTDAADTAAVFAPDGRWVAYTSTQEGQANVYVQSFPGPGGKYQVSKDGGSHPLWRADGKELFYLNADATVMAVPVDASAEFQAGTPQALFASGAPRTNAGQVYAVTKDGNRFLVNAWPQQSTVAPLTVVVNWPAAIRK